MKVVYRKIFVKKKNCPLATLFKSSLERLVVVLSFSENPKSLAPVVMELHVFL